MLSFCFLVRLRWDKHHANKPSKRAHVLGTHIAWENILWEAHYKSDDVFVLHVYACVFVWATPFANVAANTKIPHSGRQLDLKTHRNIMIQPWTWWRIFENIYNSFQEWKCHPALEYHAWNVWITHVHADLWPQFGRVVPTLCWFALICLKIIYIICMCWYLSIYICNDRSILINHP